MATIAENLQTILDIKNDIKDAIIAKGVSVADSDGFATYPSKIESIETGTASIDVSENGLKFANSTFTEIPSIFDFSNVTDMSHMFNLCQKLTSVPQFDTSKVTNMSYMFAGCINLTSLPLFDTSKVTDMSYMFNAIPLTTIPEFNTSNVTTMNGIFYGCDSLTSVPLFDTSKVTNMTNMFYNCKALTSVPQFNTSNVIDAGSVFNRCSSLTTIPLLDWSSVGKNDTVGLTLYGTFYNCTALVDVGGFKNVGQSFSRDHYIEFGQSPNLSRQSCLNIFNNLYDISSQSFSPYCSIKFHATAYNRLSTDDIAIATNKGWSVKTA